MKTNYSMMLKQLQMGYMSYTMKDVKEDEQCVYCWSSGCGCDNKETIKDDPFLNTTFKEELYV
jgi:hypothetical protein